MTMNINDNKIYSNKINADKVFYSHFRLFIKILTN